MVSERENGASQARLIVLDQKAAITSRNGEQEVKRRDTELGPPAHWMIKNNTKRGQPSTTQSNTLRPQYTGASLPLFEVLMQPTMVAHLSAIC